MTSSTTVSPPTVERPACIAHSNNSATDSSTKTSCAAIFRGQPGEFELAIVKTPTPQAGEMLIRVEGCLLGCHALRPFLRRDRNHCPIVFGHEMTGKIEAFGLGTKRSDWTGDVLEIGSRVVWTTTTSCGECFCCRRGISERCLRSKTYGQYVGENDELLLGGLAEHCLITSGTSIVAIPQNLPLGAACQLSGATALAAAAMDKIRDTRLESILITGASVSGLTLAAMARERGIPKIVVCDADPMRAEIARQFGFSRAGVTLDLSSIVSETTAGYGVDVAFDFTGSLMISDTLLPQIRMGGSIVFLSENADAVASEIPVSAIASRHLTLTGIHGYQAKHLATAVEFMKNHCESYPFESLIDNWFTLDEAQTAAHVAMNPRTLRVGVAPLAR